MSRHARRYDVAFYVPWVAPLLTRSAAPSPGGAETQVILVARALAAQGLRVAVCSFDVQGGNLPASVQGFDIVVRPPRRGRGMRGWLSEFREVRRCLSEADAEVVVTRTAGRHVGVVGFAAKLRRSRFAYSSASLTDFNFRVRAPHITERWLHRFGVNLADVIIAQTVEQARGYRHHLGRATAVIPNIAEIPPASGRGREAFIWAGRGVWYKGPLKYVSLARAVPEALFWIVVLPGQGAEDMSAEIVAAADDVPNLEVLSPRPRGELLDLISRSVAVVNTSSFEGFPNVNLEGWAQGVPALTLQYDPDGVIERLQLGRFAHGSPEELAAAAREMWNTRYHDDELRRRCRTYAERVHSEQHVAEEWQRALGLLRVAGNQPSPRLASD